MFHTRKLTTAAAVLMHQYHLRMVENQKDGSMPKEALHSYTWSEDESSKGSNQFASAVHNTLRSAKFEGIRGAVSSGWLCRTKQEQHFALHASLVDQVSRVFDPQTGYLTGLKGM